MRPVTLTTTDASGGATTSNFYRCDTFMSPFSIGVVVDVTGTVNFDVEFTNDEPDSVSALWLNHADFTAKTADTAGVIAAPCRAVRMVQNSGSGSCRAVLIQAG